MKKIQLEALHKKLKAEKATWTAYSAEEYAALEKEGLPALGFVPGPGQETLKEREKIAAENHAEFLKTVQIESFTPSSFDLRNVNGLNYNTSIKNQNPCGSCVAFGVIATLEGTVRFKNRDANLNLDYSEAHLFYCNNRQCGRKDAQGHELDPNAGWWPEPALDYLKNTGVVDETCFPYTPVNQACHVCNGWQGRVSKIADWHALTNLQDMKNWISNKGPVVSCFTVYDDFFAYSTGIYHHVSGNVAGGHCVSIVGYNDAQQYWIAKNSWGTGRGESGYYRIGYGQCGIDSKMYGMDKGATKINNSTYYYEWRGNGTHVINVECPRINANSNVMVAISEFGQDSRADRFMGAAKLKVCNVSPYNGGVLVWAEVNWASAINVCFDLLIN